MTDLKPGFCTANACLDTGDPKPATHALSWIGGHYEAHPADEAAGRPATLCAEHGAYWNRKAGKITMIASTSAYTADGRFFGHLYVYENAEGQRFSEWMDIGNPLRDATVTLTERLFEEKHLAAHPRRSAAANVYD